MKNWELVEMLQQQDPNEKVLVTGRSGTAEIAGVKRATHTGRLCIEIVVFLEDEPAN